MVNAYQSWIGRETSVQSSLDPWPTEALRATLGLDGRADGAEATLPPLWSWLYFLEAATRDEIGSDGHAAKGGFMPPIAQPKRMFAGGRFAFLKPLRVGVMAEQTRRILKVEEKQGAAGRLVFVTIGYDHVQEGGLCVRETRDIVYLDPGPAADGSGSALAPIPSAAWSLELEPDAVLLMRYSALTFNGHRIHYDLPYARDVEGYPERVVHGPLIATLLAELARLKGGATVSTFAFRARSPLFLGDTLHLRGDPIDGGAALKAYASSGRLLMTAEATTA